MTLAGNFLTKLFQKREPHPIEVEASLSRSRELMVIKGKTLEMNRALADLMDEREKLKTEIKE